MSKRAGFRIFVSAVMPELGSYRREVARVLRRKGLEVRDQEHFHQGGATLLEKLRDYIESCDAVILLVGDRCGALATPEHAAALGDISGFQKFSETVAQKEASYTQWEFFLAKHHGKKTYTFFTDARFLPDGANTETAELRASQQAYRDWIKRGGEHRDTLTTKAKLIEDVLVLPFPDLGRPKPINLPYASIGTLFKGRDEFMAQLRRSLADAGSRASAIVGKPKSVHGLGGVGKTRLAVEYAWQNAEAYTALLFVVASSPEDLRRNLAALVGPMVLDLDEQDAKEEEAKVAGALRWLRNNPGWFLVLDNVDTKEAAEAAEALLAQLHAGDVLITSRMSRWSKQVEPLELDVLTADDAVAFLLERTDRRRRKTATDEADARNLATELGELALALEQAGAYIEEQRLSFVQYLAQWQSNRDKVTEWFDPQVMQYPRSLAVTWQTSVAQLSEPARRLVARVAWLAPDPIPESLLDVAVPGDETAVEDARPALADLERYSLVTRARDEPTFTVHRLVQDVTRRSLTGEAGRAALTQVLGWVNDAFVGDPGDVRSWPTLEPLAPHALAVVHRADAADVSEPTARLMNQLGFLLISKGLFAETEPLWWRAHTITEKRFGPEHPEVAICLGNLAALLHETNRLADAELLVRRALAIDEKSFGLEHPHVAVRLSNLAILLKDTKRLGEAEYVMRRALAIDEKALGPDHETVGLRLLNLSGILSGMRQLVEAEALLRHVLQIFERALPVGHPRIATALSNLAQLLHDTKRFGEAELLMRRALSIDEASYGPGHPVVATDMHNLGALLQETKRPIEAEPLIRAALAIDEKVYGPDHPKVAIRLNSLAHLLKDTNRIEEAEPISRRHLRIFLEFTRRAGREHPHLRAAFGNYARILAATGKRGAAVDGEIEMIARAAGFEFGRQRSDATPQNG